MINYSSFHDCVGSLSEIKGFLSSPWFQPSWIVGTVFVFLLFWRPTVYVNLVKLLLELGINEWMKQKTWDYVPRNSKQEARKSKPKDGCKQMARYIQFILLTFREPKLLRVSKRSFFHFRADPQWRATFFISRHLSTVHDGTQEGAFCDNRTLCNSASLCLAALFIHFLLRALYK